MNLARARRAACQLPRINAIRSSADGRRRLALGEDAVGERALVVVQRDDALLDRALVTSR